MDDVSNRISINRGTVYIPAHISATYFSQVEAVIVIIDDQQLKILPVHQMAAGGCLLKIRNSSGDRVATAIDVFADNGYGEWSAEDLDAVWSSSDHALVIPLPSPLSLSPSK